MLSVGQVSAASVHVGCSCPEATRQLLDLSYLQVQSCSYCCAHLYCVACVEPKVHLSLLWTLCLYYDARMKLVLFVFYIAVVADKRLLSWQ